LFPCLDRFRSVRPIMTHTECMALVPHWVNLTFSSARNLVWDGRACLEFPSSYFGQSNVQRGNGIAMKCRVFLVVAIPAFRHPQHSTLS
jgi:hypothetical protein